MDPESDQALMGSDGPSGSSRRPSLGVFLDPIVVPPLATPHSMTVIFFHGRGSNARKFFEPLLRSPGDESMTFQQALSNAKFVFPTAPLMRATKYRRSIIHQWYDGTGDWEPEARGEMRPSIEYIHDLLRKEVHHVGGDARKIVLAGISQGCATALTSLLLWNGEPLGAMVGMCGFMPLCSHLTATVQDDNSDASDGDGDFAFEQEDGGAEIRTPIQEAIDQLREEAELPQGSPSSLSFQSVPVFLGHGSEDEKVKFEDGHKAAELLKLLGMEVTFRRYDGLGHWYSPEMLGHIISFLRESGKS